MNCFEKTTVVKKVPIPRWIYKDFSYTMDNAWCNGIASRYNARENPWYPNHDEATLHHDACAGGRPRLGAFLFPFITWWVVAGQKMQVRGSK